MSRLEELNEQIRALADERDKITIAAAQKEAQAHVGKHFKCRNNYSCPETEADYWYEFVRIVSTDEDGTNLIAFRFATDSRGTTWITPSEPLYVGALCGYDEITKGAFDVEWAALQQRIAFMP